MSRGPVQIVEDERYRAADGHFGPPGHPERPERLTAVAEALNRYRPEDGDRPPVDFVSPRPADTEALRRAHGATMIDLLEEKTRTETRGQIDADTFFTSNSYEIARLAAGGTIDVARSVMLGESSAGLAAVRPPGHHAESERAMGFCLFNNVAVAARAIQAEFGTPRILIVDWDVHHGNGTQEIFEEDPSVFYVSMHQFPYYPGGGDFGEAGRGAGLGTTLNIPMPAGCGDAEYVGVMDRLVAPAARHFRPDLILVSCGFDAHRDDPLASMTVSFAGFQSMARQVRLLAEDLCAGRLVHVLEGGYALSGLREGIRAVAESLVADSALDVPARREDNLEPGSILRQLVDRASAVHGERIPDLGAL